MVCFEFIAPSNSETDEEGSGNRSGQDLEPEELRGEDNLNPHHTGQGSKGERASSPQEVCTNKEADQDQSALHKAPKELTPSRYKASYNEGIFKIKRIAHENQPVPDQQLEDVGGQETITLEPRTNCQQKIQCHRDRCHEEGRATPSLQSMSYGEDKENGPHPYQESRENQVLGVKAFEAKKRKIDQDLKAGIDPKGLRVKHKKRRIQEIDDSDASSTSSDNPLIRMQSFNRRPPLALLDQNRRVSAPSRLDNTLAQKSIPKSSQGSENASVGPKVERKFPLPPWLVIQLHRLRSMEVWRNDRFEALDDGSERIECCDCVKSFKSGPNGTLNNFENHLRSKTHKEMVMRRLEAELKANSSLVAVQSATPPILPTLFAEAPGEMPLSTFFGSLANHSKNQEQAVITYQNLQKIQEERINALEKANQAKIDEMQEQIAKSEEKSEEWRARLDEVDQRSIATINRKDEEITLLSERVMSLEKKTQSLEEELVEKINSLSDSFKNLESKNEERYHEASATFHYVKQTNTKHEETDKRNMKTLSDMSQRFEILDMTLTQLTGPDSAIATRLKALEDTNKVSADTHKRLREKLNKLIAGMQEVDGDVRDHHKRISTLEKGAEANVENMINLKKEQCEQISGLEKRCEEYAENMNKTMQMFKNEQGEHVFALGKQCEANAEDLDRHCKVEAMLRNETIAHTDKQFEEQAQSIRALREKHLADIPSLPHQLMNTQGVRQEISRIKSQLDQTSSKITSLETNHVELDQTVLRQSKDFIRLDHDTAEWVKTGLNDCHNAIQAFKVEMKERIEFVGDLHDQKIANSESRLLSLFSSDQAKQADELTMSEDRISLRVVSIEASWDEKFNALAIRGDQLSAFHTGLNESIASLNTQVSELVQSLNDLETSTGNQVAELSEALNKLETSTDTFEDTWKEESKQWEDHTTHRIQALTKDLKAQSSSLIAHAAKLSSLEEETTEKLQKFENSNLDHVQFLLRTHAEQARGLEIQMTERFAALEMGNEEHVRATSRLIAISEEKLAKKIQDVTKSCGDRFVAMQQSHDQTLHSVKQKISEHEKKDIEHVQEILTNFTVGYGETIAKHEEQVSALLEKLKDDLNIVEKKNDDRVQVYHESLGLLESQIREKEQRDKEHVREIITTFMTKNNHALIKNKEEQINAIAQTFKANFATLEKTHGEKLSLLESQIHQHGQSSMKHHDDLKAAMQRDQTLLQQHSEQIEVFLQDCKSGVASLEERQQKHINFLVEDLKNDVVNLEEKSLLRILSIKEVIEQQKVQIGDLECTSPEIFKGINELRKCLRGLMAQQAKKGQSPSMVRVRSEGSPVRKTRRVIGRRRSIV